MVVKSNMSILDKKNILLKIQEKTDFNCWVFSDCIEFRYMENKELLKKHIELFF